MPSGERSTTKREALRFSMHGRILITQESASLVFELTTPRVVDIRLGSIAQNHPLFTLETPLPSSMVGQLRELLTCPNSIRSQGSLPRAISEIVKSFCGWFLEHCGTTTPVFSTVEVPLSPTSSDGK